MKIICYLLLCISLGNLNAQPEKSILPLNFEYGRVDILEIENFSGKDKKASNDPHLEILRKAFGNPDYKAYKSLFYENCPVNEDEYWDWKTNGYQNPTIISKFIFTLNFRKYAIIQYTLSNQKLEFLAPFTLQEIDGKWYLLDRTTSADLGIVKGFFTTIKSEAILEESKLFAKQRDTYSIIDAQELVENMFAKYNFEHPLYEKLNQLFHNPLKAKSNLNRANQNISQFLDPYNLTEKESLYVTNLINGVQIVKVAEILSQQSGKNVPELVEDLKNLLNLNSDL